MSAITPRTFGCCSTSNTQFKMPAQLPLAIANGWGWQRFVKIVDQVLPKKGNTLELGLSEPNLERYLLAHQTLDERLQPVCCCRPLSRAEGQQRAQSGVGRPLSGIG